MKYKIDYVGKDGIRYTDYFFGSVSELNKYIDRLHRKGAIIKAIRVVSECGMY